MKDGAPEHPSPRALMRDNPDRPDPVGMREWFSFRRGESRPHVPARDAVFMRAIENAFIFVLAVAPVQAGLAWGLALLINQRRKGINAPGAICLMPVVVSIMAGSLLWRLTHDGDSAISVILFVIALSISMVQCW